MKKVHILLCDTDALWLGRLHGYLKEHLHLPVSLSDYTHPRHLQDVPLPSGKSLLVIDRELLPDADCTPFSSVLVLTEDGPDEELSFSHPDCRTCSRFRKASDIVEAMLLTSAFEGVSPGESRTKKTKVIGYYSPLARCMQTSMAITAGQLLARKSLALYLNFDAFPAPSISAEQNNLADLLYYFSCDESTLSLWVEKMKQRLGRLYLIPPPESFLQTQDVQKEEWIAFLNALCKDVCPDVLLLDLSSHIAGLPEILSVCDEIYTITGADAKDREKIDAYRRYLALSDREDILERTRFCSLPKHITLPSHPGMLKDSALAAYLVQRGLLPDDTGR